MLPARKKRQRMGVRTSEVVRCAGHLAWVRGHECAIAGRKFEHVGWHHICGGKIEAHHVREGQIGGMGLKPDDSEAVPLCSEAHREGHTSGWKTFEEMWGIDLDRLAAALWQKSPHRLKYEQKQQQTKA